MGLIGSFIKQTINQVIEQTSSNLPLVLALTASGGTATVVAYKAIVSNQAQTAESSTQNLTDASSNLSQSENTNNHNKNQNVKINTENIAARRSIANSDSGLLAQSPSAEQTIANRESEKINTAQERQAANSGYTSGYSANNTGRSNNSRSQNSVTKDSSPTTNKKNADSNSAPSDKKILGAGGEESKTGSNSTDNGTIAKSKDEPPTIQLTALTGGQTVRGNNPYTLTWKASGQHVTAATPINIEFSSDNGASWNVSVSKIPNTGSYSWNVPNVSSTTCLARVSIQDDAGLSASAQSTTTFTVDNVAPTLTLIAPTGGESIKGGGSFNILWSTIEANPATLPIKVEYTANGSTWNTIGTYSSAGPATWTIPSIDTSIAQVRVTATDLAGNSTSMTSLPFSIDGTIPTISSVTTTLASGAYPVGQVIPIDIHFSETIVVTGTPQLTLNTTPTARVLNYASSSGSVMSFSYTVQSGDNSTALDFASTSALSLNGGTIKDSAGNNATLTLPTPGQSGSISASKTIVIDTVAPNRPNIYLTSPYFAQTAAVTMTAANCTDTTELYITENSGETPDGTEVSWQTCSTTANAITYTLTNTSIGPHPLYVWAKDSDGNISATSKTVPLKYTPELILGQADESTNLNQQVGFYSPTVVKYINGKFYVVSAGTTGSNSKIGVFNTIPTSSLTAPDLVLGQQTGFLTANPGIGPNRINQAFSVESDGTKFVVTDFGNNRVLLWNTIPSSPETPADVVLGQTDFYSNGENNGKGATPTNLDCSDLRSPRDAKMYGGKLYISDTLNHRVLIWNTWPTTNNQPADLVLGQSTCATKTAGVANMNSPIGIEVVNNKLFIADTNNNRVLIWNALPTTSGQAADLVLGQTNMTTNSNNAGGVSASSMQTPRMVHSDGIRLFVSDYSNKRILIWNTLPTTNKQAADVVVGQSDFTSVLINQGGEASATGLNYPTGIQVINGDLWIADYNNHRALRFNGIPTTNGEAAAFVLGQGNFKNYQSIGAGTNDHNLHRPYNLAFNGTGGFIILDSGHNRIMGYNSWPTSSSAPADFEWGQADFTSDNPNRAVNGTPTSQTLQNPTGILIVNNKLFISDTGNNRILGFNSIPNSASATPDFVLGQSSFTTATSNSGGVSATSLFTPNQLTSDGTKLAVVDKSNNRILIWNTIPTSTNKAADVVIGQPDMTSTTANTGGLSAATLSNPYGVVFAENKMYVSDSGNKRILIWDPIPTVSGTPANYVIGQLNMTTSYGYNSSLDPVLQLAPVNLYYNNGKLIVVNLINSYVQIWNTLPTSNNAIPDVYFGQGTGKQINATMPPLSKYLLGAPLGVSMDDYRIFIPDYGNHRLVVTPIPEFSITSTLQTNNPLVQLTVHDCTNRAAVLFNESTKPLASDSHWQNCVTTKNALSYTVSAGEGYKYIKAWFKDADGNVSPNYQQTVMLYLTTNKALTGGTLASYNSNSSTISFTSDYGHAMQSRFLFSESSTMPSANDPNWQPYAIPMTYNLTNLSDGVKTIYIWGIDPAGNITPMPNHVTYTYDTTPPTVPSVTVDGYYAATTTGAARLTVSSCADASKIFVNDTGVAPTINTSGWVTCTTTTNGTNASLSTNMEGNHTLSIWAQDSAGNISTTPATLNFNFNSSLVLGQSTVSDVSTAPTGLAAPNDMASDGTNYFVADTYNGRVLIYNGDPTQTSPSLVLGQTSLTTVGASANATPGTATGTTASNIWNPYSVAVAGTKLIVADENRNRVLIWNTIPTVNNQPADVVVGQATMTDSSINAGGSARSCNGLSSPRDVQSDGTRLIVTDYGNHRVLIWNTIPTTNNQPADVVIGQTSCTNSTSGTTQTTLKNPMSATIYGSQLFIADYANNRVLIYNNIPTSNGAAADIVIGQTDFTTGTANVGGSTTGSTLSSPSKVRVYNNKIYVNDKGNFRVLVYNSIPISNGVSANISIGQTTLAGKASGSTATNFSSQHSMWINSNYLWVVDTSNNQIKRFTMPLATGMSATAFTGSFAYTYTGHNLRNSSTNPTQSTMQRPTVAIKVNNKLIVSDYFNHRVLIWNAMPTSTNQNADVVIGHNDFVTATSNDPALAAAARISYPLGLSSDGTNLVVSDSGNNRVLIFNTIPTTNGASADLALGQANFTTLTANRGGTVAANTLSSPIGVYTNGTRLYVADYNNHRVLMWTSFPTTMGQAADIVLGQTNMTSNSNNQNGSSTPSAITMSFPRGVLEDNGKLFVSEYGNNRVLIWNNIPSSNDPAADIVVGQTSMTTGTFGATASVYQRPYQIRVFNGKLLIPDANNSRIVGFNSIPTTNGQAADFMIGQYSNTGSSPNNRGISAWSYDYPTDIVADGTSYWIVDMFNHRLVKVQLPY